MGNALALHQLHFAPEVLPISELEIEETKIKDAELKLAQQLVEQQTSDRFEPTAYTDEVKARIEAAIQRKVEGEQITLAEAPPAADGKVIDLMEALRASLKRNTGARAEPVKAESPKVESIKLSERKPPKRVHKKAATSRKASSR
jgi:DNA end-binding protein Ku